MPNGAVGEPPAGGRCGPKAARFHSHDSQREAFRAKGANNAIAGRRMVVDYKPVSLARQRSIDGRLVIRVG